MAKENCWFHYNEIQTSQEFSAFRTDIPPDRIVEALELGRLMY